jgi:tetratricopeptide (TPR) repeat protein
VYSDQREYDQAETVLKRAINVREKAVGANNPELVVTLNRLATVYQNEGKYTEAETLIERGLTIREKAFGVNNLNVAISTQALADLYRAQKRDAEPEVLLKRAISIEEKALQPSDPAYPSISWTRTDLGKLYEDHGRYSDAEPEFIDALRIYQNSPSPNYFNIGDSLYQVAVVFALEGKNAEADSYFKQTLATMEKTMGRDHPFLVPVLETYSALLQNMNRTTEATEMKARAQAIRLKTKQ